MIHLFPEDIVFEEPSEFTDPFRYVPHPAVRMAAGIVMERINADTGLAAQFSEGKMLGILVCRNRSTAACTGPSAGRLVYIAAFSGNIGGKSTIEGFVPPIYDLTDNSGEFKKREAEISVLNSRIEAALASVELEAIRQELSDAERNRDRETGFMKSAMTAAKKERDALRAGCTDSSVIAALVRTSQHEKAELKRLKTAWKGKIADIKARLDTRLETIDSLKRQRATMSERLQDWIFRQYVVHNALGEKSSIADIFADEQSVPPGGTGECAAPKLLEYAYRNSLAPVAMGEFWYGKASETAVRCHGRFYPSCTSKCGPLLRFMMKGLRDVGHPSHQETPTPIVIHEDEAIIVMEKPAGMPSVPGLDGRLSLQEWLPEHLPLSSVHAVHRLDLDTSGVMVFAKTAVAAVGLRKQFEEHSVRKTYMARVSAGRKVLPQSDKGSVDLPLSPDYDERPRQKADFSQGKPAHTEYETVRAYPDGSADLLLHPVTGRTHQLRIHCAHTLGLDRPIIGDLLYGGYTADSKASAAPFIRLHLHALSITFRHPLTGEPQTFTSSILCY